MPSRAVKSGRTLAERTGRLGPRTPWATGRYRAVYPRSAPGSPPAPPLGSRRERRAPEVGSVEEALAARSRLAATEAQGTAALREEPPRPGGRDARTRIPQKGSPSGRFFVSALLEVTRPAQISFQNLHQENHRTYPYLAKPAPKCTPSACSLYRLSVYPDVPEPAPATPLACIICSMSPLSKLLLLLLVPRACDALRLAAILGCQLCAPLPARSGAGGPRSGVTATAGSGAPGPPWSRPTPTARSAAARCGVGRSAARTARRPAARARFLML